MQSESKDTVDVAAMPSAYLATIDAATNDEYTRLRKEVMLIVAMVVDDDGMKCLIGVRLMKSHPKLAEA